MTLSFSLAFTVADNNRPRYFFAAVLILNTGSTLLFPDMTIPPSRFHYLMSYLGVAYHSYGWDFSVFRARSAVRLVFAAGQPDWTFYQCASFMKKPAF